MSAPSRKISANDDVKTAVAHLVSKIAELVYVKPEKAAIILSAWIKKP